MRRQEAMEIINRPEGFMVAFEVKEHGMLRSDYFPDQDVGEALIPTEKEAWDLAEQFAGATTACNVYVNVYVVDSNYRPVEGYRKYNRYPRRDTR